MANVNVTDGGIPERTLTLQYKPLPNEAEENTPKVAGGEEIKLYAESIKEVFKKEPQFQSIQKGREDHFKGDKTLVIDTMNAKHTFEITAYVYAKGDDGSGDTGKVVHSLPPYNQKAANVTDSFRNGDGTATVSDKIKLGGFGEAQPLGDPGIIFGSEGEGTRNVTVTNEDTGDTTDLDSGDYDMDYDRGEITFNDNGGIESTQEDIQGPFGVFDLGDRTVIQEDYAELTYDFDVSAQNIASQIRKMAQLGNPMVMRLDEKEETAGPNDAYSARGYLVTPKAVNIVSESENPARYKIELELRKGTVER